MLRESLLNEIRSLPLEERKQLVMFVLDTIADPAAGRNRRLLDFEGVGERLRDDTQDPKDYVRQMRDEWDEHP